MIVFIDWDKKRKYSSSGWSSKTPLKSGKWPYSSWSKRRYIINDAFRMLQLQDVKTDLAEAALGEGGGVRLNKMSVKEIQAVSVALVFPWSWSDSVKQLFGMKT